MSADNLPAELGILDSLVRQSRLNDAITEVLHTMLKSFEVADEADGELREDIAGLAVEVARLNTRVASLTETVGQLMVKVEPLPTELHSVKVPELREWYPSLCRACGHMWDAAGESDPCPECDSDDVTAGPLTRWAADA